MRLISSTTRSAARLDDPSPVAEPPKSLTTTLAPRAASSSAYVRPRPLPAPVTTATRPSKRRGAVEAIAAGDRQPGTGEQSNTVCDTGSVAERSGDTRHSCAQTMTQHNTTQRRAFQRNAAGGTQVQKRLQPRCCSCRSHTHPHPPPTTDRHSVKDTQTHPYHSTPQTHHNTHKHNANTMLATSH